MHTITRKCRCEGVVNYRALQEFISELLPEDAPTVDKLTLKIFVTVPGGGDHSYEDLNCETDPVRYSAEWTETE